MSSRCSRNTSVGAIGETNHPNHYQLINRGVISLFTMYEDSVGKFLSRFAGVDIVIETSKGLPLLSEKIRSAMAEMK
jgi:hypothetical protein